MSVLGAGFPGTCSTDSYDDGIARLAHRAFTTRRYRTGSAVFELLKEIGLGRNRGLSLLFGFSGIGFKQLPNGFSNFDHVAADTGGSLQCFDWIAPIRIHCFLASTENF